MKKTCALLSLLIISFVFGCQTNKNSKMANDNASWAQGMQSMAKSLESLLPFVYSKTEFNDVKNRGTVVDLIEGFQSAVQVVPKHVGDELLGKDPLLKYSLDRLQSNANQSLQAFKEGHTEFARNTLKESVSTCFNCHSATNMGPEFKFTTANLSSSFRLYPTEKADFYVATRQFDRAVDTLEPILSSPTSFYDSPHEQALALRKYLSLQVRVKKDPIRSAKTLENFLNNKKLPYFLAADAETWLSSLRDWSKEVEKGTSDTLAKARRLLQKAKRLENSRGFQAGLIEHMRATSLLHESLRTAKNDHSRSKIYYSLGTSYDVLTDLGVWDLPDVYFEACIRSWPKSNQAKSCYRSFERSIVLGFSGSAGVFIPAEERKKLAELKGIAGL